MVILIQKVEISNFAAFLYATKLLISTILILIIVLFIFFYVLKHNLYILNILINLFTFGITYKKNQMFEDDNLNQEYKNIFFLLIIKI